MKKKLLQLSMLLGLSVSMAFNATAQVGTTPGCPGAFGPVKIITGTNKGGVGSKITANTTFYKDTIYILKKFVRVASGATLTVQAGTIIMGMPAPADTSCLIIEKGAKIIANGTVTSPIVFTSCRLQGTRRGGDWCGIVICGDAKNNLGTNLTLEGNYGAVHGGTNDLDNSGSLKFVRIEYAGLALEDNKELNGLTLASVGRGTIINNIQVSFANDDSFEWFGGAVSSRYLISWKSLDDDFDTDNGFSGNNQFGFAYRDADIADFSGSNGFESDNDAAGSTNTPKTKAIFSNYEIWGPRLTTQTPYNAFHKCGAHIRRSSELKLYNTLLVAYPGDSIKKQAAIQIDGLTTIALATADSLRIRNSVAAGYLPFKKILSAQAWSNWAPYASPNTWYNKTGHFNQELGNIFLDQKKAPIKAIPILALNNGSVALASGSSFQTGGTYPLTVAAYPNGFQSVNNRGAFSGTDWTLDWTEFHPNTFIYTAGAPTRKAFSDKYSSNEEFMNVNSQVLCYPNPTSATTTLSFNVDNNADAIVSITDASGSQVYSTSGSFKAGVNTVDYSAANLEPGMYYVHVLFNSGASRIGKLVVVR